MKKKSFTLMEIVVGLIILATVFGGLTATFVGVKRYVARATRRLTAANLGRQVVNALASQVRADTWNAAGSSLAVGSHKCDAAAGPVVTQVHDAETVSVFVYGAADGNASNPNNYVVSNVAGRQYRQVDVNVQYPVN